MRRSLNSTDISAARGFIMGFSILWVVFFHYDMGLPEQLSAGLLTDGLNCIIDDGYFGVDLFLFLSAYGCVHSFHREPNITTFFIRRCKRLLPCYLFYVLVLELRYIFIFNWPMTVPNLFGNLTCTGIYFRLDQQTNWYLQAIWLFYLLFPILYALIVPAKRPVRTVLLLWLLSLCILAPMYDMGDIYHQVFCRLLSFLLGVLFGRMSLEKQTISKQVELACYLLLVVTAVVHTLAQDQFPDLFMVTGIRWSLIVLMLPGLIFLLTRVSQLLSGRLLRRPFILLGSVSMELLITHLMIRDEVCRYVEHFRDLHYLLRLGLILLSCVAAVLLRRFIAFLTEQGTLLLSRRQPSRTP